LAGLVAPPPARPWLLEAPVRQKMIAVVEDFLRQTERIVSVVPYASVVEEWKERGMLRNRHQFREFDNPRHRFDQGKSWVLFRDFEVPPDWKGMQGSAKSGPAGVGSLSRCRCAEHGEHYIAKMERTAAAVGGEEFNEALLRARQRQRQGWRGGRAGS
jgi:hypothetical protein